MNLPEEPRWVYNRKTQTYELCLGRETGSIALVYTPVLSIMFNANKPGIKEGEDGFAYMTCHFTPEHGYKIKKHGDIHDLAAVISAIRAAKGISNNAARKTLERMLDRI